MPVTGCASTDAVQGADEDRRSVASLPRKRFDRDRVVVVLDADAVVDVGEDVALDAILLRVIEGMLANGPVEYGRRCSP